MMISADTRRHMHKVYLEFGTRLRRARKSRELSQDELALRAGIGRATIATIEMGKQTVALHQLYSLSEALHISLDQLLPPQESKELIQALGEQNLQKSDIDLIREMTQEVQ